MNATDPTKAAKTYAEAMKLTGDTRMAWTATRDAAFTTYRKQFNPKAAQYADRIADMAASVYAA